MKRSPANFNGTTGVMTIWLSENYVLASMAGERMEILLLDCRPGIVDEGWLRTSSGPGAPMPPPRYSFLNSGAIYIVCLQISSLNYFLIYLLP